MWLRKVIVSNNTTYSANWLPSARIPDKSALVAVVIMAGFGGASVSTNAAFFIRW